MLLTEVTQPRSVITLVQLLATELDLPFSQTPVKNPYRNDLPEPVAVDKEEVGRILLQSIQEHQDNNENGNIHTAVVNTAQRLKSLAEELEKGLDETSWHCEVPKVREGLQYIGWSDSMPEFDATINRIRAEIAQVKELHAKAHYLAEMVEACWGVIMKSKAFLHKPETDQSVKELVLSVFKKLGMNAA